MWDPQFPVVLLQMLHIQQPDLHMAEHRHRCPCQRQIPPPLRPFHRLHGLASPLTLIDRIFPPLVTGFHKKDPGVSAGASFSLHFSGNSVSPKRTAVT